MGHFSRFQRCLLPHTNTGTIQEISKIPCPGPDLSIQGTALWSVHSTHGVHCISKGGETDGHTQGYKNPPVPRRLVGESQIPTPLSPTHPNPGQDVPGPRLAGESREIRTGTQTSIRLTSSTSGPAGSDRLRTGGKAFKTRYKHFYYYRPVRSGSSCP